MWFKKKLNQSDKNYVSYDLFDKPSNKHDIFCALCGTKRSVFVKSPFLNGAQHLQVVLASIFIAWALFPLIGAISFFLYPFVWMATDIAKKTLYRKGAQCKTCGFDAITYAKDVTKAKTLIKTHIDQMPKQVIFKRGYGRRVKYDEIKTDLR